jgi:hypothetical protein
MQKQANCSLYLSCGFLSTSDRGAVFEARFICSRMRLLLLLAAMIVARSQCAQWVMQNGGQNDNTVMAGDKELKPAADQVAV